jgi:hypothetical protein
VASVVWCGVELVIYFPVDGHLNPKPCIQPPTHTFIDVIFCVAYTSERSSPDSMIPRGEFWARMAGSRFHRRYVQHLETIHKKEDEMLIMFQDSSPFCCLIMFLRRQSYPRIRAHSPMRCLPIGAFDFDHTVAMCEFSRFFYAFKTRTSFKDIQQAGGAARLRPESARITQLRLCYTQVVLFTHVEKFKRKETPSV